MKSCLLSMMIFLCVAVYAQDKQYLIVFLNKKADVNALPKEQLDKIMEGHLANIKKLAAEKKLLAAGPFIGGGGIFILNTTSVNEATEWLKADPGIQAQRWHVEMFPYIPRYGSVCSVKEPYEMIMYHFVRFDAIMNKFTTHDAPKILKQHDAYIKTIIGTGNVVTEASFGEGSGGILVLKGELQQEVIEADPGVQQGLVDFQLKKLYIAKGSFCEH
jgi:uncharacterized protein YciI